VARVGPGLPERRDRRHDEASEAVRQIDRVEVERGQIARRARLEKDVGVGQQREQPVTTRRRREVDGDAALVAVAVREPQARAVGCERWPLPRRCTARRLDSHHVGAQVAQHPSGERTPLVGEVDDAHSRERQWCVGHP
jgi:hypothetical protein